MRDGGASLGEWRDTKGKTLWRKRWFNLASFTFMVWFFWQLWSAL